MRYFKREVLASLFEEMLTSFIQAELARFKPRPRILPMPDRDDLEVDWELTPNHLPLYLFAIRDATRTFSYD
jgi:hypothetical protein